MATERKAIYPGSFDPLTYGHIDIIERAKCIFDKIYVTIAQNSTKKTFFEQAERFRLINDYFESDKKIEVSSFKGLLVDFAKNKNAGVIIRGMRTVSDFEYEMQMAQSNKNLANEIETFFMITNPKYSFLSSTLIKEIAVLGGSVSGMVPPEIEKLIKTKLAERKNELK